MPRSNASRKLSKNTLQGQRGSTVFGFIIGLLVGLILAVVVAFFASDVRIPDSSSLSNGTLPDASAQGANDMNTGLMPQSGAAPADTAPGNAAAESPTFTADPVLPLGEEQEAARMRVADAPVEQAYSNAGSSTGKQTMDSGYYVQAGAFRSKADAEVQRAKLAFIGEKGIISEHIQAQKKIYRVRIGPFTTRVEAQSVQDRMQDTGIDTVVVGSSQ